MWKTPYLKKTKKTQSRFKSKVTKTLRVIIKKKKIEL